MNGLGSSLPSVDAVFFTAGGLRTTFAQHFPHQEHELNIVTEGTCRYRIDNGWELTLHVGDILIMPAGCQHQIIEFAHTQLWGMHIHPRWLQTVLHQHLAATSVFRVSNERRILAPAPPSTDLLLGPLLQWEHPLETRLMHNPNLHQMLADLFSRVRDEYMLPELLSSTYLQIIGSLIAVTMLRVLGSPAGITAPASESSAQVFRVKTWLDKHYQQPITISELAEQAHLSNAQFRRLFQQHFGIAPKQYMLRLRLQHAARRLLETTHAVHQIIDECGFTDSANFFDAFKERYGVSPGIFRTHYATINPMASPYYADK